MIIEVFFDVDICRLKIIKISKHGTLRDLEPTGKLVNIETLSSQQIVHLQNLYSLLRVFFLSHL